jgi:hypothetical protein
VLEVINSFVDISPVPNAHYENDQLVILYTVDDAVVADANPIVRCVAQDSAATRARIVSEAGDALVYSQSFMPGKFTELA